ncbi:HlyD family secretion protein [Steroidobacter flavus]|uniref:HlyD family secretion protein n=1 Tax=Steroidobacter flavus TaxID=1842136 RepID=A0ABV8SPC8_9GAMM
MTSSPSAPAAGPVRLNPKARVALVAGGITIAVVLSGWFIYHQARGRYFQDTNDAYIRADSVVVSPKIGGYVAEVLIENNQDVTVGQPLVRIDAHDYQAQAEQIEAQIDVAEANAANVRATIREQHATIAQGRARLAAARAKANHDANEVKRYEPLAASGAEPQEKLEQLRTMAVQSANDAESQAAALQVAERRLESLETQVRQAKAQGQGARAQLSAAQGDLQSTTISAAMNGRIGNKTVTVGQFVQPGTRLMSIVPLDKLYVEANFKETQIGLMRIGQAVNIEVDTLKGVELHGTIASFAPGTGAEFSLLPPKNATGNFTKIVQRVPVRITLEAGPEARKLLVPGLSVTVTVDTRSAKDDLHRVKQEQEQLLSTAN